METFNELSPIFLIITIFWVLPWKAYGLWMAVKNNHKLWFLAILIINTFGILEIIYIFVVLKKKFSEVKRTLLRTLSIKKQ